MVQKDNKNNLLKYYFDMVGADITIYSYIKRIGLSVNLYSTKTIILLWYYIEEFPRLQRD